jgi:hypothetical protein
MRAKRTSPNWVKSIAVSHAPVIESILRHLKLWDRPERPPPAAPMRSVAYDLDVVVDGTAGDMDTPPPSGVKQLVTAQHLAASSNGT